jgi:hypothetical protein
MPKEKETIPRDFDEILEMFGNLEQRIIKVEKRIDFMEATASQHISGEFERWLDAKVRGFEYGPELKAEIMPKVKGKNMMDSKKLFYECRDKLFEKKYPDAPRGPQTWRW